MNKIALITWASSGIWKELSLIHASHGGDLIIIARRKEKLETLKAEIEKAYNTKVMIIVKDLTQSNAAQEIYTKIKEQGISIDYLINNAGFWWHGKFYEREWQQDKNMILLNIMALTELTRLFLPDFVHTNSGKILNVTSTASFMPGPLQAVYFATKAYAQSFTNAIAYELHDTKVTVTNLMPWATQTEFAKTWWLEDTPLFQEMVTARSVAQDGYDGMIAGKLDVISGLWFFQKLMMYILPFVPKNLVLKQVYDMQKKV